MAGDDKPNANGFFPYTPATNLLYGLKEAVAMLQEEGLDNVFARHQRLPRPPAPPSAPGAWKCYARIRPNIRRS